MDMNLSKLWGTVKDRETRYAGVHVVAKSQTGLTSGTTITNTVLRIYDFISIILKKPLRYLSFHSWHFINFFYFSHYNMSSVNPGSKPHLYFYGQYIIAYIIFIINVCCPKNLNEVRRL